MQTASHFTALGHIALDSVKGSATACCVKWCCVSNDLMCCHYCTLYWIMFCCIVVLYHVIIWYAIPLCYCILSDTIKNYVIYNCITLNIYSYTVYTLRSIHSSIPLWPEKTQGWLHLLITEWISIQLRIRLRAWGLDDMNNMTTSTTVGESRMTTLPETVEKMMFPFKMASFQVLCWFQGWLKHVKTPIIYNIEIYPSHSGSIHCFAQEASRFNFGSSAETVTGDTWIFMKYSWDIPPSTGAVFWCILSINSIRHPLEY